MCLQFVFYKLIHLNILQGFDGGPPIQVKEEPEDGPRSMQKVPSISDLSDPEASLGEYPSTDHIRICTETDAGYFLRNLFIQNSVLTIFC